MKQKFALIRKARRYSARLGPLVLVSQEAVVQQVVVQQAAILGRAGIGHVVKWSVTTIVGLGAYDTVTGATAMLTQLAPAPGSSNVPATAGEMLNFVIQLTGTEHPAASWEVSGALPNGLIAQNPTNSNLNSINGTPTQSGDFPIVVTVWEKAGRTGESKSKSFTINVAGGALPPSITTQPASARIDWGGAATLSVAATGEALTYQWYEGAAGDTSRPVSGATSATYVTPALQAGASYWVRVSNGGGAVDSAVAHVTVVDNYQSWSAAKFTPSQLADPLVSGPTADPDGDRFSNEQEYVFGGLPLTAEWSAAPTFSLQPAGVAVSFEARAAAGSGYSGMVRRYTLESTSDLAAGSWLPVPGYENLLGSGQVETYVAPAGPSSTFFRLRANLLAE